MKALEEAFESGAVRAVGAEFEISVKEITTDQGVVERHPGDSQTWTFYVQRVDP